MAARRPDGKLQELPAAPTTRGTVSFVSDLSCPRCATSLSSYQLKDRVAYRCAACSGLAVNMAVLRAQIPGGVIDKLWRVARQSPLAPSCPCPACKAPTRAITDKVDSTPIEVDLCMSCQLLWLDHRELDALWSLGLSNEGSTRKARRPGASKIPSAGASADGSSNLDAGDAIDLVELVVDLASGAFSLFD